MFSSDETVATAPAAPALARRSRTSLSAATSAAIWESPQSLSVPVCAVEAVRRSAATSAQAAAIAERTRRCLVLLREGEDRLREKPIGLQFEARENL